MKSLLVDTEVVVSWFTRYRYCIKGQQYCVQSLLTEFIRAWRKYRLPFQGRDFEFCSEHWTKSLSRSPS